MQEKIRQFMNWFAQPKTKKRMYVVLVILVALWVIYRFVAIGAERRMVVFNPVRAASESGYIVETMPLQKTTDVLREPITVKNNRAMVTSSRVGLLRPGLRVGDGQIESVAGNIDIDTGMYPIRTSGVSDGLNFVEYKATGYFVPTYALVGNTAYVVSNGVATARDIRVSHADEKTSVVTDGLNDGDILILSRVIDGQKVQIKQ